MGRGGDVNLWGIDYRRGYWPSRWPEVKRDICTYRGLKGSWSLVDGDCIAWNAAGRVASAS